MTDPSWLFTALSVAVSVLASWQLTRMVRGHALARSILDLPNHRSLHQAPTPRGGGLSIVAVVLGFLVVAAVFRLLPWNVAVGIGGGGSVVALVGWRDDVSSVPAIRRLVVHFFAALWVVGWLGGLPLIALGGDQVKLGTAGAALAVLGIVWATNLFNFMDGSDGIVAVEVISVGSLGGSLLFATGNYGLGLLGFVLAGAALGFAWWNWAPARIFLGDVGSGFVGFTIGALAVASENAHAVPVTVWLLLSCVFLVDATLTLFRRLRMGHWREPHRTHAYQMAIQGGWSHRAVAGWVAALNVILGFIALTSVAGLSPFWLSLAIAALGCAILYVIVITRYARART
jgi:Fuc2NAc and GlcNAc transferase